MCAHASTTKTSLLHLISFQNILKKFLFTVRDFLKPAVIVILISAALAQLTENQKIVIYQQNGRSGKRYISGRITKNQKSETVGSLSSYLCTIFPAFFIHSFAKRKKGKSYKEDKQESVVKNPNTVRIQVDFVENYTCAAQDEV